MKPGQIAAALLAGLLVGGGTVAFFALRKGKELELRGTLLSASLTSQGSAIETTLAARGSAMEPRLAAYAEQAVFAQLGLTRERIAGLQRLMQRFGV